MRSILSRREASVLLVVDVQEKLAAAMPPEELRQMEEATCRLIRGAHILGLPVLATEQYPRGLGPTTAPVREALGDVCAVEKLAFSCLDAPELRSRLTSLGREQVIICGMEAHVCVLQTALAIKNEGWTPLVVADAVISRKPLNRQIALDLCRQGGATVTSMETVLFGILGGAGSDDFKAISRLVR